MNKKSRFLITILLCISVLCLFAGIDIEIAKASGQADPQTLVVWCHAVHEQFATGFAGAKIDVASEFEKKYNVKIEWVTIPWTGMQDKVLRQISLGRGEADVVFYVDDWAYKITMGMFESLDTYMKEKPIEAIEEIPESFWVTFSLDGHVRAFPYSAAYQILHYNDAYYKKFGISGPPASLEDLVEIAKKTTFKKEDGSQVYGLGILDDGSNNSNTIAFIRACGGEVLTSDFQIKINEKETVYAISLLRDLYQAGSIPPDYTEINTAMYHNLVYQGLLSNLMHGASYAARYDDPEQSNVVGEMGVSYIPASEKTSFEVAPSKGTFWGAGIPKNSPSEKKQLAYEFLHFFSTVDNQIKMALNLCSSFRVSAFANPEYSSKYKWAPIIKKALPTAGQPIPSFPGNSEVYNIVKEQCFLAISGKIEVQEALDKAADLIEDVLKREGIK